MSIIIVDDNATNQLIVQTILNKAGYRNLLTASSARELYGILGIEGSAASIDSDVELILMDMMMPDIDGIEACRNVLQDKRYKDIPIIFVTAVGDSNKMAEALDAGACDYVMKPINRMELLARIRSALRLKHEIDRHKEHDKKMKSELELAKQVQLSVLSTAIDDENLKINAAYQPSSELAGDFYNWYRIDRNRYGVILLDMMGHGISSSLVCMYISSVLRDTITRISDIEQVMHELNRYMNQLHMKDELMSYYFTAIYLVLDVEEKTIEYVNAGHPPGIAFLDGKPALLEPCCSAIGLFNKLKVSKGKFHYEQDAGIVLYTDGLTDGMADGHEISNETLISLMRNEQRLDPSALVATMIPNDNGTIQKDDICLVTLYTK
ncbi:sigma-B regulation protein RsbU (phosphoserine phosphatase) [Paenibacillus catalpae]|uniref:Sigma-B regulation protein RsbU (Phosphoserine phosphatase) n=1 Tax=Paenibacillus catalpae TaxID=1045775 RepID=A0A1I2BJ44_9BACL|nr:fused response regulator/phosphatase [Paenibacillus catalpae]SFE56214.1 sigma-B regulation protein RsbU (phosphoserine phosphatase) [Paenibacillus catalpae]